MSETATVTDSFQPSQNVVMEKPYARLVILLSPLVIIGLVHLVARVTHSILPDWSWLFTAIVYWGLTGLAKILFTAKSSLNVWFHAPKGKRKWLVFSILIGVFPALGILLPNLSLLNEYVGLTIFWALFALINPWFEEGYWRGLLLDARGNWSKWAIILYSTLFFVLSHPLMWGVFSIANRSYQMYATLIVLGIFWSWVRFKTGSLRWAVYSHMLVDLGNLSIFVFLNLYIPPGM